MKQRYRAPGFEFAGWAVHSGRTAFTVGAFWLTRAELRHPLAFLKVGLFGDLGWAGDRAKMGEVGRPASGAGVGFSFFDGAARHDIARGIYPSRQTAVAFYLGATF